MEEEQKVSNAIAASRLYKDSNRKQSQANQKKRQNGEENGNNTSQALDGGAHSLNQQTNAANASLDLNTQNSGSAKAGDRGTGQTGNLPPSSSASMNSGLMSNRGMN